jgi:hypothetical protein
MNMQSWCLYFQMYMLYLEVCMLLKSNALERKRDTPISVELDGITCVRTSECEKAYQMMLPTPNTICTVLLVDAVRKTLPRSV